MPRKQKLSVESDAAIVLDSFAILAYLSKEAGAKDVKRVLEEAAKGGNLVMLPMINLGEVLYIVERHRGLQHAEQILELIDNLPVDILEATRPRVIEAAHVKANYALSYADAFAVAAAKEHSAKVITGDPEFSNVEELIEIAWLPAN